MGREYQQASYNVGDWIVHPDRNLLIARKEQRSVSPQVMALLCEFLHHHHVTLTRDQLLDKVWKRESLSDSHRTVCGSRSNI